MLQPRLRHEIIGGKIDNFLQFFSNTVHDKLLVLHIVLLYLLIVHYLILAWLFLYHLLFGLSVRKGGFNAGEWHLSHFDILLLGLRFWASRAHRTLLAAGLLDGLENRLTHLIKRWVGRLGRACYLRLRIQDWSLNIVAWLLPLRRRILNSSLLALPCLASSGPRGDSSCLSCASSVPLRGCLGCGKACRGHTLVVHVVIASSSIISTTLGTTGRVWWDHRCFILGRISRWLCSHHSQVSLLSECISQLAWSQLLGRGRWCLCPAMVRLVTRDVTMGVGALGNIVAALDGRSWVARASLKRLRLVHYTVWCLSANLLLVLTASCWTHLLIFVCGSHIKMYYLSSWLFAWVFSLVLWIVSCCIELSYQKKLACLSSCSMIDNFENFVKCLLFLLFVLILMNCNNFCSLLSRFRLTPTVR